jgi:cation-transporting P-type ATPase F
MQSILGKHWHHLPADEVLELLNSDAQRGLDLFEIQHRRQRFGPNALTPRRGRSPLVRFLHQFNNPLIYILLAASVITAVLKDVTDALIIFAAVLVNAVIGFVQETRAEQAIEALALVNAVIGFVQETRAEQAIEALAQRMSAEATVTRAGHTERVPAADLVPGDIVLLAAGDRVPADLRLLRTRDLQTDESALTGESLPVQKDAECLPADVGIGDRCNMAYSSSLVTSGQGQGIVVATGDSTEIGRISQLIASATDLATPLTRKIAQFSHLLLYVILALAALTMLVGALRGQTLVDVFLASVALAVSAIPEGLPAAVTVTLAIGVSRMAQRRAIIRKLPAVETLGSTTVICSDKTGTLTQNQMTVVQIAAGGASYTVTGGGYAPTGQIIGPDGDPVNGLLPSLLSEVLAAGLLCNDSRLIEKDGRWQVEGDPTEGALIAAAWKAGLIPASLPNRSTRGRSAADDRAWDLPRLDVVPFDAQHQYMATLHDAGEGRPRVVYVKGSVEAILARCTTALDAAGQSARLDATAIHAEADGLAAQGLRVLAFARGELPSDAAYITHGNVATGLAFLGLQGMIDPPRPEAIRAVQACQAAGISVKMITGDHAKTAAVIACQIGLKNSCAGPAGETPTVLTGRELAALSDEELIQAAEQTAVFARVSPEQKLRLVEALQARNHVVAMTGDGVNDAPALKQANIGVAMGVAGTEVSKEAADMVLTDDNFATIESAVEEGRGVFDNLTKIIAWTLPTNLGEALIILAAIFAGVALPILPAQILWINMITVVLLGLVLAMETREPDIMQRRPRAPDAPILTRALLIRVLLVGGLILVAAFGLYEWALREGRSVAQGRTIAVNVVIFIELFYLFNCRSLTESMFKIGVFSNPWAFAGAGALVLIQLLFTYAPFMNSFLSSAPLALIDWGLILAAGVITYCIVEIEKWLRRRNTRRHDG